MLASLRETIVHLFHPRQSNRYRSKIIHPDSILALSAIIFVAVLGIYRLAPYYSTFFIRSGSVLGYASDITVQQVVDKTNQARQVFGLAPLKLNQELSTAAANKAAHMMAHQYWAHTAPSGEEPWYFINQVNYKYKVAGENLARDFSNGNDMMKAWLNSPSHRANIMNSRYQDIGVAVVNGTLQGVETTLVVQMFGTRQDRVAEISPKAVQIETGHGQFNETGQSAKTNTIQPKVLGKSLVHEGSLLPRHYYHPLDIIKSMVISSLLLIIFALFYDWYAMKYHKKPRVVGKNLAHILLFATVICMMMMIKMGRVI